MTIATRRLALLLPLAAATALPLAAPAAAADPRTPLAVQSRVYDLVSRVENLAGTERVSESRSETTYSLQAAVLFAKDSADISAQAKHKIDAIAQKIAQANPGRAVEIRGFTDNLGSAQHGLELSTERANAVKQLLEKNPALSRLTFTAKGFGEAQPIADNSNESGRQKNRRVEIVVPTR
ncbi:OmpA family protein [Streptomyces sp. NPDC051546]|uniref:OmpA family protein n=1 Tax=Streptomyces sp. NPDC051546 TaxID=3365655 RepID=UPI0037A8012D